MSRAGRGILAALACGLCSAVPGPEGVTLLADLPADVRAAAAHASGRETQGAGPAGLLARILQATTAYRFEAGPVSVETDRRWFASLPFEGPGGPLLELRRWPGDSVLALYALPGAVVSPVPRMEGGAFAGVSEETVGAQTRRSGDLTTDAGPRPALWVERHVPGAEARLGALLLPGDAGLGEGATSSLTQELLATLDRVAVDADAFARLAALAPAAAVIVPKLEAPPGERDERTDPWQVVEGRDMTLGLPPGLRARRVDLGMAPPGALAGELLWFRGRFIDREGVRVEVGDGDHAGYVVEVSAPGQDWLEGRAPPRGAPGAAAVAGEPFPLAAARTGAVAARAERWREPGFAGEWLVFRLAMRERGIELGFPVLEGRRSPALFWVPVTWRGAGEAPAAPPIDPSDRFGIRFQPLTRLESERRPWVEGELTAPGVRADVPQGWFPRASLRTRDGFPILFHDATGRYCGGLHRLGPVEGEAPPDPGLWTPVKRPAAYGARAVWARADGARLLLSARGDRFVLEPAAGVDRATWNRLAEKLLLLTVRPGRR